jgi:tetraacyldisaccharide 4'-kinase
LQRPVVSVGNLTVGGTGKTPLVASIARLLIAAGERPAVLSRGYARRVPREGVVVVAANGCRAGLEESGDEPTMLARMLPDCSILVCPDRYLAGALAESRLGCTVHLLDDGFQHVALGRDVDLLMVSSDDMLRERLLPAGRLREPVWVSSLADAWIVDSVERNDIAAIAHQHQVSHVFSVTRVLGPLTMLEAAAVVPARETSRVLLVSGLARPDRFEADVRAVGWNVVDHLVFPDHHAYDPRDIRTVAERQRASAAHVVVTTEKDAVRFEPLRPLPFPLAVTSLSVRVDDDGFGVWLMDRLAAARNRKSPEP